MAGNTFGDVLRVTTFGESHGAGLGCVLDGVPPGIKLSEADIQKDLDRRRPGQSEITTQRQEADQAEILSGVMDGETTGAPIAILIRNTDQRSQDYSNIKDIFRPGHADFTFTEKFGVRDHRGGGRSSGRETAARVAAGAIAKKLLEKEGIQVIAYVKAVAAAVAESIDLAIIEKNIVRMPDAAVAPLAIEMITTARDRGDSLGGIVEAVIKNCPAGLGDPVFGKLEAKLALAMLSIGAIKGFEFGSGFKAATMKGSQHNDVPVIKDGKVTTKNNFAGGISGGISNGEDIVLRVAVKPPASIAQNQQVATTNRTLTHAEIKGRHDPCLCPRVVPVVEAMAALVIADCLLIQKTIK